MAVIWGFNLSEMSWGAFGHARMFDRRWHLRRERFGASFPLLSHFDTDSLHPISIVVYQLAMLISLAAEVPSSSFSAFRRLTPPHLVHSNILSLQIRIPPIQNRSSLQLHRLGAQQPPHRRSDSVHRILRTRRHSIRSRLFLPPFLPQEDVPEVV